MVCFGYKLIKIDFDFYKNFLTFLNGILKDLQFLLGLVNNNLTSYSVFKKFKILLFFEVIKKLKIF